MGHSSYKIKDKIRQLRDTFRGKAFRETFRLFFRKVWKDGKFTMTLECKPERISDKLQHANSKLSGFHYYSKPDKFELAYVQGFLV